MEIAVYEQQPRQSKKM